MKFTIRTPHIWVLPAICLVLMSGCAQKTKAVASALQPIGIQVTEEVDKSKLIDLPLETLVVRGNSHMAQGEFALAKIHFQQALRLDPESAEIHMLLGGLFLKMKQADHAKKAFANALVVEPSNFVALSGAGRASRLLGQYPEAELYFQKALLARPADPEIVTELAICYDAKGKLSQSEKLYRQVSEQLPENSSAFNNLGFNCLLQGKYSEAIKAFKYALLRAPQEKRVQNNLAVAYIMSGNEGQGLALFANTVGQAGAYNNVGYIYIIQKKWDNAEKAFARALELSPNYYVKSGKNLKYLNTLRSAKSGEFSDQSDYNASTDILPVIDNLF